MLLVIKDGTTYTVCILTGQMGQIYGYETSYEVSAYSGAPVKEIVNGSDCMMALADKDMNTLEDEGYTEDTDKLASMIHTILDYQLSDDTVCLYLSKLVKEALAAGHSVDYLVNYIESDSAPEEHITAWWETNSDLRKPSYLCSLAKEARNVAEFHESHTPVDPVAAGAEYERSAALDAFAEILEEYN